MFCMARLVDVFAVRLAKKKERANGTACFKPKASALPPPLCAGLFAENNAKTQSQNGIPAFAGDDEPGVHSYLLWRG